MRTFARRLVLLLTVGPFAFACDRKPARDLADGQACESNFDCQSLDCLGGFCAGRGCELSDPASCDPGWRCTRFEGGFFSSGSVECVPLCGVCPGNRHCPLAGVDGSTACVQGPPRKVTIEGPDEVKVGTPLTLSVTIDPPMAKVTSVDWLVGEKAGEGTSFFFGGETLSQTLELNVEGDFVITALVSGLSEAQTSEAAEGAKTLRYRCLTAGEVCKQRDDDTSEPQRCCASGLYCPGQTGSDAPRVCAPLD